MAAKLPTVGGLLLLRNTIAWLLFEFRFREAFSSLSKINECEDRLQKVIVTYLYLNVLYLFGLTSFVERKRRRLKLHFTVLKGSLVRFSELTENIWIQNTKRLRAKVAACRSADKEENAELTHTEWIFPYESICGW